MRRLSQLGIGSALVGLFACTDLGLLSSGDDDPPTCAGNEQRVDDRCVPTGPDGGPQEPLPPGASCPEGQQDRDGDRLCAPTCATANLTCVHASCDDASGKATCVCAPGYKREAELCVWGGGLLDPGFQNQPVAWQLSGGVTIDPVAVAAISPGAASFTGLSACTLAAKVTQTIQMPTVAEGEPFALEVNGANPNGEFYPHLRIGSIWVGGVFFSTPTKAARFCLGERAYGKDVELTFEGDPDNLGSCSETSSATIDHAGILAAADCPIPGQVPNGDFEGVGTWVSGSTNAEVASGVGSNSSRGGRIFTTTKCQSASLSGKMSAPWKSMDRPALSFTYKGTTNQRMIVGTTLGDFGEARGTNTFQAASFCMPEYAKGVVLSVKFALPYRSGTSCADPDAREFVFDDLKFVSDPKCPQAVSILNGDFETTGVTQPWAMLANEAYGTFPTIFGNSPSGAHGGNGFMQISLSQACSSASAHQMVTTPASVGTAGPAVKFWYKLPVKNQVNYAVSTSSILPVATVWTQKVACLDPNAVGRPTYLPISGYASGGGSCGAFLPGGTESLMVDDVEVTTDPSCPAQ